MRKNKANVKLSDKKLNDLKPNDGKSVVKKKNKSRNKSRKYNNIINKKEKTICKYPEDMSKASINWKRLSLKLNSNKANDKNSDKKSFKTNKTKIISNKKIENKCKVKSKSDDIWFDGVDKCLIKSSMIDTNGSDNKNEKLFKEKSFKGMTQIVGIDCEMCGTGSDGSDSVLTRVSIVNFFGHCIYDEYVKPIEEITDYRTHVSGIRPSNLVNAKDFKTVQKEVHDILKDRIIVGHALKNDFKCLFLSHPKNKIRDTSRYFKHLFGGRNPSLKRLSETVLGVKVQTGEHDSVEDARVAMRLFTMFRRKWELHLKTRNKNYSK